MKSFAGAVWKSNTAEAVVRAASESSYRNRMMECFWRSRCESSRQLQEQTYLEGALLREGAEWRSSHQSSCRSRLNWKEHWLHMIEQSVGPATGVVAGADFTGRSIAAWRSRMMECFWRSRCESSRHYQAAAGAELTNWKEHLLHERADSAESRGSKKSSCWSSMNWEEHYCMKE